MGAPMHAQDLERELRQGDVTVLYRISFLGRGVEFLPKGDLQLYDDRSESKKCSRIYWGVFIYPPEEDLVQLHLVLAVG